MAFMDTEQSLESPMNMGSPNEFTILDLAQKVISLTNSSSELSYKTLPMDDPKQRQPDISLAKKVLNWEPTINLKEGLKKTIPWYINYVA